MFSILNFSWFWMDSLRLFLRVCSTCSTRRVMRLRGTWKDKPCVCVCVFTLDWEKVQILARDSFEQAHFQLCGAYEHSTINVCLLDSEKNRAMTVRGQPQGHLYSWGCFWGMSAKTSSASAHIHVCAFRTHENTHRQTPTYIHPQCFKAQMLFLAAAYLDAAVFISISHQQKLTPLPPLMPPLSSEAPATSHQQ